ncbi:hypothetical protein [Microtetraspora niveoalba]|uniref:hypothetical protein n=1 Tax=Microtetraspora niveoalba TaxID=46175 RepID=UPI001FE175C6|nr:hypothetical protein [Microtetraspora niveoalba]
MPAAGEIRGIDGDLGGDRFVALYREGDRLAGALTMNGQAQIMKYRGRIATLNQFRRAACQPSPWQPRRASCRLCRTRAVLTVRSHLPVAAGCACTSISRRPSSFSTGVTSRVDAREGADDGVPVQLAAGVAGPASWVAASSWVAAGPVLATAPGGLAVLGGRRPTRSRPRSAACSCSCWADRPSRHAGP